MLQIKFVEEVTPEEITLQQSAGADPEVGE